MTVVISVIKRYTSLGYRRYGGLPFFGKMLIWLLIMFYAFTGAFIVVVTPGRIAQYLYDHARMLAATRFGWLALAAGIVLVSFPPLIGHTTLVTLCGFAYGMKGFYIASCASIVGASVSFLSLRLIFRPRLRKWSEHSKKWQALEAVVREKGLPLMILIRVSPFPPWVYSISLFASIEAVALWQFVIATSFIFPKLALHVFIGSRIAALSDGEQRGRMDTETKIINSLFVVGGLLLATFTSWLIYDMVQRHIRRLEGIPPEVDELAAEAIEDYREDDPLLSSNSVEHA